MQAFVEWIRDILSVTAWEMERPPAYGALHLTFMLVGFAVSIFLAWRLRGLGERGHRRILLSVGTFLLISEVYKQLMYEVVLEPSAGYRWGIFPFQMCSIPMYLCLIIPFLKAGRIRQAMYNFIMTFNLLGGFISFFEPSGLLHGHWTLTMHALIWHMLLVFMGFYVGFSRYGGHEKKDFWSATALFGILSATAFCLNCAFWEISNHQINMFFVGPAVSSIIVYKQIGEWFGWYVGTLVYLPTVTLGALVFFELFRLIARRTKKEKV